MPDPNKSTVSATESPALFGLSPYATRWMLFQRFANGLAIDDPENNRMSWGKKLQPLVLAHAADELRLEVQPHDESYVRRGVLGATRDAVIVSPDKGPGALECKCVFDYRTWMDQWEGGKRPPSRHEIQLQQQMFVGDGETPYAWGILAAWVGGEVFYFERAAMPDLQGQLVDRAGAFLDDVRAGRAPNPFGVPMEEPLLKQLFPTKAGKVLDLSAEHGDATDALITAAQEFELYRAHRLDLEKKEKNRRAELLAAAGDAATILLPFDIRVNVKCVEKAAEKAPRKASVSVSLDVYVPPGSRLEPEPAKPDEPPKRTAPRMAPEAVPSDIITAY